MAESIVVLSFECGYCILGSYLEPRLRAGIRGTMKGGGGGGAQRVRLQTFFSPYQKHGSVTCMTLLLL